MCRNIVVSPKEYMKDKIEYVRKFYDDIKAYGYTFTAMLDGIVESTLLKKSLSFSIGIKYQDKQLICNEEEHSQDGLSVKWNRCIGELPHSQDEADNHNVQIYVYYFISANEAELDLTFLHCAEEIYYEWIVGCLSDVFHAVEPEKVISKLDRAAVKKQFQRDVAEEFNNYMREIFSIDPEIIAAISGIYYERETCCSTLSFCLTDIEDRILSGGVTLDLPIEVGTDKIKRIRKLLQMGNEEQCLLICRKNSVWQVKGLYAAAGLLERSLNFQIVKHMVWKMTVGKKFSVCFENGKYIVKSREFELYKIQKRYEELFEQNFTGSIKKVCQEAIEQTHGTTLIIIKEKQGAEDAFAAERETERLIIESTGTKIKPMILADGFVRSVTSIDGALIVDSFGKCYGFGMILDGPREDEKSQGKKNMVQGNPACGARHNSAMRYMKKCQDNGLKAIAVVVSEDGPITIFATDDESNGGNENA